MPEVINEFDFADAIEKTEVPAAVGLYFRTDFYTGQDRPRRELIKHLKQAPTGSVSVISEPLGAGKTSFLYTVCRDLFKTRALKPGQVFRVNALQVKPDWTVEDFLYDPVGVGHMQKVDVDPQVVIVEELDRKNSKEDISAVLEKVSEIAGEIFPQVVLSGDYSLRNPDLLAKVRPTHEPKFVSLDPLTPLSFRKALQVRLEKGLRREVPLAEVNRMTDSSFLQWMIPNTDPKVATMRTTWVILESLVNYVWSYDPMRLNGEYFMSAREYEINSKRGPDTPRPRVWQIDRFDKDSVKFLEQYYRYINDNYNPRSPFPALNSQQFFDAFPMGYTDFEAYKKEILELFLRANILKPTGVPYLKSDDDRTPEPYLPSQETFLEARFGPIQGYETQKALEKEDTNKEKLDRLLDLYLEGHIDQNTFNRKKAELST